MGENILPSSPIPTSANLVKIKSGEDYAKVFFKEERPRLYPAPYDYETVKSYCKDGDQIQSIEISYSKTSIPKDTSLWIHRELIQQMMHIELQLSLLCIC